MKKWFSHSTWCAHHRPTAWYVTLLLALLFTGTLAPVPRTRAASVIYVNTGASGANNGSSWTNAYASLQVALGAATSGSELWVAKGTYRPAGPGGDRNASFVLKSGVALYGGFAGTETQRGQRDWAGNLTILSGDLSDNDGPNFANNAENSYHVVVGGAANGTAILDGFTVSGGNADSNEPCPCGGGMYNLNSSPSLTNVTFSGNGAQDYGGGMYNENSSPTLITASFSGNSAQSGAGMSNRASNPILTNITFSGNTAQGIGGGMYNLNSSPILTSVTFSGNAAEWGGGMDNLQSNPTLSNVLFSGNAAQESGGGMSNYISSSILTNVIFSGNAAQGLGGGIHNMDSNLTVQNSIVWGNVAREGNQIFNDPQGTVTIRTSIVQGGYPGSGIMDADPLFVAPVVAASAPTTTGDLRLRPGSPAIDAGDTTLLPAGVTTDRDGMPRVVGPRVDLGAFEAHAQLNLSKTVDRPSAGPTERITYRLMLDNTGAYSSTVTLSDTLPSGLTVAGPVTVEPVGGMVGAPPTLVRDLVLRPGQTVIVHLPVNVDVGQCAGTLISNTASLSGTNAANTSTSTATVTIDVHGACTLYLPLVVRAVDE